MKGEAIAELRDDRKNYESIILRELDMPGGDVRVILQDIGSVVCAQLWNGALSVLGCSRCEEHVSLVKSVL